MQGYSIRKVKDDFASLSHIATLIQRSNSEATCSLFRVMISSRRSLF